MSWEIIVNKNDFVGVLKKTKTLKGLGKKNIAAEVVELMFTGTNLTVLVTGALHTISAEGSGGGTAFMSLASYQLFRKALVASPPKDQQFQIKYNTDTQKITFGGTTLGTVHGS